MKRLLVLALLLAAFLPVFAQKQVFYPEDALRETQIEVGGSGISAGFLQVNYTKLYYKRFAWRAGGQFVLNPDGYEYMLGIPLAVVYRSETATTEQALDNALTVSYDPDPYYYYKRENLAGSILLSALAFLIRRIDVYAGVTPGYYLGPANVAPELRPYGRFFLSADAGLSLSIPVWRFTLSATPALHYAFLGVRSPDEGYSHGYFSLSFGLGYVF